MEALIEQTVMPTMGAKSGNPRVCIIAHNALGALRGDGSGHVGGAEYQTSLMAKRLVSQGFEVSLITWDEGQKDLEVVSGVTVVKLCPADAGLPVVRFFHPRMTGLFAAMLKADADVYYHNSAEYVTGLASWWCRKNSKKFVYSVASDVACEKALPALSKGYERRLYANGLKNASVRIVQTEKQAQLLREQWGLESTVLDMPCPGPDNHEYSAREMPARPKVLWVGRIVPLKRLEWLLDVAEKMPRVEFDIASAPQGDGSYISGLRTRAEALPNVSWLGFVPREGLADLYREASCLCCTSEYEGFPNTFLEAWSHGCPVATTFDPDGLVERLKLGVVAGAPSELAARIGAMLSSDAEWQASSENARRRYAERNLPDVAFLRFEKVFQSVFEKIS